MPGCTYWLNTEWTECRVTCIIHAHSSVFCMFCTSPLHCAGSCCFHAIRLHNCTLRCSDSIHQGFHWLNEANLNDASSADCSCGNVKGSFRSLVLYQKYMSGCWIAFLRPPPSNLQPPTCLTCNLNSITWFLSPLEGSRRSCTHIVTYYNW